MKKLLPTTSLCVGGGTSEPCRQLDGYVATGPQPQQVRVRRRAVPLGCRLMQMAIARYEDHAQPTAEYPGRYVEA